MSETASIESIAAECESIKAKLETLRVRVLADSSLSRAVEDYLFRALIFTERALNELQPKTPI